MSRSLLTVPPPITTSGVNEFVAVRVPNSSRLLRITVVGTNGAVDMFSRSFSWSAAITITKIVNDGNSKAQITAASSLALAVGDLVTVASTSGYNGTHRVTALVDARTVVTDHAYVTDELVGTINLAVSASEQNLYKVIDTITVSSNIIVLEDSNGRVFLNADPKPFGRGTKESLAYFKFAVAGTYRLSLLFALPD